LPTGVIPGKDIFEKQPDLLPENLYGENTAQNGRQDYLEYVAASPGIEIGRGVAGKCQDYKYSEKNHDLGFQKKITRSANPLIFANGSSSINVK